MLANAQSVVREVTLDNRWRITYTPYDDDVGYPFALQVDIETDNGGTWQHSLSGQIQQDGCCDWGFGKPTMMHYCGKKDAALLFHIFVEARKEFWPDEDE